MPIPNFKREKSKTDKRDPNYRGTGPRVAPPAQETSAKPPGKPRGDTQPKQS